MNPEIEKACMFVLYEKSSQSKTDDLLIVKERVRNPETGAERPTIRLIKNYKRQFAITKKGLQGSHKQKKEWEFKQNLDFYECTTAELPYRIAKALNVHGSYHRLGDLCKSPYVYGSDITSPVLYKQELDNKYNANNKEPWNPDMSIAVMDFETDVVNGTDAIISGAVSFKDKALITVTKDFLGPLVENVEEEINKLAMKHLKDDMTKRNIKLKVVVCDNDFEVAARLMAAVHALKPDFLVFWNMGFDMKHILRSCDRHHKDPADIFCDPCIPKEFRRFNFRESKANKVTASGKKMNYAAADLWHVVECPSSFYVIDAMVVFKMLRVVEGMRRSYSLDATLESELGIRKLDFDIDDINGSHNISWHRAMQSRFKLIYMVYNLFDCISVELLDEKTGDLAKKIALYADGSEFSTLKSNPKRLANSLHFYLDEQDKVLCSTSSNMTEAMDRHVIGKRDWIVTLANELTHEIGANIFDPEHAGDLQSRIATHIYDIDISSGYPSGQWALNVSRGTTLVEVCKIVGQTEHELRRLAVNMTCVPANSIDIGRTFLGLPNINEVLSEFGLDKELATVTQLNAEQDLSFQELIKIAA